MLPCHRDIHNVHSNHNSYDNIERAMVIEDDEKVHSVVKNVMVSDYCIVTSWKESKRPERRAGLEFCRQFLVSLLYCTTVTSNVPPRVLRFSHSKNVRLLLSQNNKINSPSPWRPSLPSLPCGVSCRLRQSHRRCCWLIPPCWQSLWRSNEQEH